VTKMWFRDSAKKKLTDITDWGQDRSFQFVTQLLAYAKKDNLFVIIPCEEPEAVLIIRKRVNSARMYGFWVGFGRIDRRTLEDFVVITSERKHQPVFEDLILDLKRGMNLPMIIDNGLSFSLSGGHITRSCRQWSGTKEELANAYRDLRGIRSFSFEGQYDTSIGRARLEHARKNRRKSL